MMKAMMMVVAVVMAAAGCASAPPTAWEQKFYDIRTNIVPIVVVRTNVVELTNYATVTITNRMEVINEKEVVVPVTNVTLHTVYATNLVVLTNVVEKYDYNQNTNAAMVAKTAGDVASTWGPWGNLVGIVIGAAFGAWGMLRSSKANKTAEALAQVIETGKQLLRLTPQGADLDVVWTKWMQEHQRETGTMLKVIELLNNVVDEPTAKSVARDLAEMIKERTTTS